MNQIQQSALKEIKSAKDLKSLDLVHRKYLGRKGELTKILRSLSDLPKEKKADIGRGANAAKRELEQEIKRRSEEIRKSENIEKDGVDITAPGIKLSRGSLHPLTLVRRQIEDIFGSMGFEVIEGPDIETEYYNFDALNIPPEHPARDMWDTFWLLCGQNNELKTINYKQKGLESKVYSLKSRAKFLLRTHTSPMQVRYMETHQPPFKIIVPGRCFRYEATDASHSHTFYQVEGLMLGKDISLANLKGAIESFINKLFKKGTKVRWRPGYFPFVEPGLEADVSCQVCEGEGCSVCGKTGWLEIMGAGMVHPNVLKYSKINPKFWQGFAFGMGLDRIAMMKYKIDDIRLLYGGDLRFLKQF